MNASNNCPFDDVNKVVKYVQLTIYIPTFILGAILNALALWAFCFSGNSLTVTSIFMVNLALSDLLLLISLPFKMHFSWQENQAPKTFCTFVESLYFVNMYVSILTITCISVIRFMVIRKPQRVNDYMSNKKACVICICIWLFLGLGSILVQDFHNTDEKYYRCFHNLSDGSWSAPKIISLEVVGFIIPLLTTVFCSTVVIKKLLKEITLGKQCAIRMIAGNLIVFIVAFTPSHIGIFLQFLVRAHVILDCNTRQRISLFVQVAMTTANVNCCLDAICYYFAAKEFRKELRKASTHSNVDT